MSMTLITVGGVNDWFSVESEASCTSHLIIGDTNDRIVKWDATSN